MAKVLDLQFQHQSSNEYSELISFKIDWFDPLEDQGSLKSLLQNHNLKALILWHSAFFMVQLSHLFTTTGKTTALIIQHIIVYKHCIVRCFGLIYLLVTSLYSQTIYPQFPLEVGVDDFQREDTRFFSLESPCSKTCISTGKNIAFSAFPRPMLLWWLRW